jgi:hypothetical protein
VDVGEQGKTDHGNDSIGWVKMGM